jgi:CRP-like cAMP-binding protein
MAQREIGLLAGLSRETTSRTLSKLRANGTVVDDGDSIVLNNLGPLVKRGLLPASAVPGA